MSTPTGAHLARAGSVGDVCLAPLGANGSKDTPQKWALRNLHRLTAAEEGEARPQPRDPLLATFAFWDTALGDFLCRRSTRLESSPNVMWGVSMEPLVTDGPG